MKHDRVLVTGAGGFIGGRVAELLAPLIGAEVRAGLSGRAGDRPAFPAGVEPVVCNVSDPASLDAALEGVGAVVHCARGPGDDERFAPQATSLLLERARAAGVRRLVLMSSVAVYGAATGDVAEDAQPSEPVSAYGRGKRAAEALCRAQAEGGLQTTVLRPTLVYGPGSRQWTTPYLDRFASGRWRLLGERGQGCCNLVFVDDLARLVAFALSTELGPYLELNANGPEIPTWNSYLERFNAALGHAPLAAPRPGLRARVLARRPLRVVTRRLLRRAGRSQPVLGYLTLSPWLGALSDDLVLTPSLDEIDLFAARAVFSMARARRLGFIPTTSVDEGLALTAHWARSRL